MRLRFAAAKVLERQELAERVLEDRQNGLRLAFTNGCFDLLHAGHVRYLHEARHEGDRLIVAINSDAAVTRLKGAGRPLLPAAERAIILSALSCVDYVTIFSEPTPHALLQLLQPDILVKGGDYGVEGIVGREVVWDYGGEVKPMNVTPGLSTTQIINRCQIPPIR